MAHEVEQMAYANEVPWHGLGENISPDSTIEEWQIAAGLNWTVKKAPVLYINGAHVFKDRFVLYRDTDSMPMGIAAGRYKIVQPKELLEFYRDLIARFGMKIETAGSLRKGKRVWALAKMTDAVYKVLGKDQIDGYLLLATSYDSTFSTLAQFTTVRVVCNNTLQMSMADKSTRITIPHVQEFDADKVKDEMGIGKQAWEAFCATSDALAKAKLDDEIAKQFIDGLFDVTKLKELEKVEELAVAEKHAANVLSIYDSPAPASALAGKTAWGLVNAVTSYVDHSKRARGTDGRLNSAWFGEGAQLKQQAWDRAVELVEVR